MNSVRLFVTLALAGSLAVSAPARAADCTALAGLGLHDVTISTAEAIPAQILKPDPTSAMTGATPSATDVGPHCLVEGKIGDREGVNGRYGIRFQMRLPDDWNGRFLFQGGGGTDGFIAPAIGAIPSTGSTARPALERGYAVVSMDAGHEGFDLSFGHDQQARLDLAYVSIGKVTNTAKALMRAYYENAPTKSFFMGCSNGGREAMMAAQRFPTEFDGIVAGNPGFHLTAAALGALWDVNHFAGIAPDGELWRALSQEDLDTVSDAILDKCDALDGLADGIVAAYSQCRFDIETLRGRLADEKVDALSAVMSGARDADGEPIYSDWPWDPGISAPGWRAWKLGTADRPARHTTLSVPGMQQLFLTPPRDSIPEKPDYRALAQNVASVGGYFDADETYLTTFSLRGGKMVIFQGLADPIFSANDIARWYEAVTENTSGNLARLFMVPGMTHCGGGAAFEDFDPLTLLENWVETGEAPAVMPASAPAFPDREMPICAYPAFPRYTGGDVASADSFTCVER